MWVLVDATDSKIAVQEASLPYSISNLCLLHKFHQCHARFDQPFSVNYETHYLPSGYPVGAHMLICIYAQSQSKYCSVFSLILFIVAFHSFHCSHTVTIFLIFFPIFPAILFTSKGCHFDMAQLILLLFKHPQSCTSCRIKSYHTQHTLNVLSGVDTGAELGICGMRHSLAFPSSVF